MLRLLLVCLLSVAKQVATENAVPIEAPAPFPRYVVSGGRRDGGDFPVSGAKLCLRQEHRVCFTIPSKPVPRKYGGGSDYFGLWPKAEPFPAKDTDGMVLFYASTGGGSGTSYRFALLRDSDGKLQNLLPTVIVSNNSDHALWSVPGASPMPVFVVADFIWEGMQAHYGDHRYAISAYLFSLADGRYRQVLKYETSREYPSTDLSDNRESPSPVLLHERAHILELIQRSSAHPWFPTWPSD